MAVSTPYASSVKGMRGFVQDITHVKLYSVGLVGKMFEEIGLEVVDARTVHFFNSFRDALTYPSRVILTLLTNIDFISDSFLVIGKKV